MDSIGISVNKTNAENSSITIAVADSSNISDDFNSDMSENLPSMTRIPGGSLKASGSRSSRANYCQFETPADETRSNFGPDDFDEILFTGQLENSCTEPRQFDEEMEPQIVDTADHSESSDVEDNYLTNNVSAIIPESTQEDLNSSSDNADEPMNFLDRDGHEEHDQDEVPALDENEIEANTSSSTSPLRKRKGDIGTESPEALPLKKSVKEEVMDDSGAFCNQMNSPDTLDEGDLQDKVRSTRSVIPTKQHPPPQMDAWLQTYLGWSHAERLMAINELIDMSEPTQVRHMMQVIEPQFQRDFISLLPKELALYVLSFLEPKDLLKAAQTCRYWRVLADDNLLWREKCREAGIGFFSAMSQRIHRRTRVNQMNGDSQPPNSRWKSAFMRQHNVEMNWRYRPIRPAKILKGHDDHVITCLQFSGNRIVSGSDDNTLKVWSATTGKCLRTLLGHTGGVWSSQMSGTTIVSGSTDRTLRVWHAETGHCIYTLYGHTSTVRCMHLYDRKVVSGSRDATLRMWDVDSGECLHVLVGHMAAVRCVQYNGHLVVSGAYDFMVRIWDPEREECLHQLSGHTNRVYSLQFDGVHVVSGSLDTSIRVWDVESGSCKHTLMGHQSLTSGMELRDNLLVSGNADSTVKIWDISTGQCLLTLSGTHKHLSAVTCLQLINKFVITSSDDGTVKLWDIKTGDFVRDLVALASGGSGGVVWRIRASETKLVCAVGSRNGTEETKLLVLDFDTDTLK